MHSWPNKRRKAPRILPSSRAPSRKSWFAASYFARSPQEGLDKKPDVQGRLELVRQGVLINALLSDYVKSHPISDDKLKKEYDAIKTQMGSTEYKARHVLAEKEEDAKAIMLDKGESLLSLPGTKDPGSKDNGGDLGWNAPASYVKLSPMP